MTRAGHAGETCAARHDIVMTGFGYPGTLMDFLTTQPGIMPPLSRHAVFSSVDAEEVNAAVSQSYCPHALDLARGTRRLAARHHRFPLTSVSLNYLQYGAEVTIDPRAFEEFYMLELPLSGTVRINYGKEQVVSTPGRGAIISPTVPLRSVWSADCGELMVKISRAALENYVADELGAALATPLEFTPSLDLGGEKAQALVEFVRYLVFQADVAQGAYQSRQTTRALERALFSLLLAAQNHTYSEALERANAPVLPRHVASAKRFVDANLRERIGPAEIMAACDIGESALYDGFRRFLGTTPLQYIKNRRLENIRTELESAPRGATVTTIAADWGVTHFGRFSQDYLRRFGEKPSQTLRR